MPSCVLAWGYCYGATVRALTTLTIRCGRVNQAPHLRVKVCSCGTHWCALNRVDPLPHKTGRPAGIHTTWAWDKKSSKAPKYFRGEKILRQKVQPIQKHRRVTLIDDKGSNLGDMDGKVAMGMAQGLGLEVVLVKAAEDGKSLPVFKMATSKAIFDEQKAKKKVMATKNPQDVVKAWKIGTRISDHDLAIKVKMMERILAKGSSVRVLVEIKGRTKGMSPEALEAELEKRVTMLDEMAGMLASVGTRVKQGQLKKGQVGALFRATHVPTALSADTVTEEEVGVVEGEEEMGGEEELIEGEVEGDVEGGEST